MRDLNFALFLFRFQSLCLGAFEADAFVFVDPEHLVFGNCFFANFADFNFFTPLVVGGLSTALIGFIRFRFLSRLLRTGKR